MICTTRKGHRKADEVDYAALDYGRWSRSQRTARWVIGFLLKRLGRIRVAGMENIPASGPVLLTANHLSLLDGFLLFCLVPRPSIPFVKVEFNRRPFMNWILTRFTNVIYLDRKKADFQAMFKGLTVLRSGGALGIAPEGHRSKTGGLGRGRTGVAYLAIKAVAPIVPIALCGQERAVGCWLRGRRVPITVRVGPPIDLPPGKLNVSHFQAYTETVMLTLARMLPPEYRGIYADRVQSENPGVATLVGEKETSVEAVGQMTKCKQ